MTRIILPVDVGARCFIESTAYPTVVQPSGSLLSVVLIQASSINSSSPGVERISAPSCPVRLILNLLVTLEFTIPVCPA